MRARTLQYLYLMRLDKPIGILLLLWPTLWALWLAGAGHPNNQVLFIFVAGVVLMRSAGCVLNDVADRHLDSHVKRTCERPLAAGRVTLTEALSIAFVLSAAALMLVIRCNALTIGLAFVGAGLTILYPLMKRYTHLPQVGLGVAFSWGVPMAFAAQTGSVSFSAWFLFLTCLIWPVIYDTLYAMVDREDDLKVGIKSTAILFNAMDKLLIGLLQVLFVIMLVIVGLMFQLHRYYYYALLLACLLFAYQQWLIRHRDVRLCFQAFKNNNWVGLAIFAGIVLSFLR